MKQVFFTDNCSLEEEYANFLLQQCICSKLKSFINSSRKYVIVYRIESFESEILNNVFEWLAKTTSKEIEFYLVGKDIPKDLELNFKYNKTVVF